MIAICKEDINVTLWMGMSASTTPELNKIDTSEKKNVSRNTAPLLTHYKIQKLHSLHCSLEHARQKDRPLPTTVRCSHPPTEEERTFTFRPNMFRFQQQLHMHNMNI